MLRRADFAYAKALGEQVEGLTDEQKRAAFRHAVTCAGAKQPEQPWPRP